MPTLQSKPGLAGVSSQWATDHRGSELEYIAFLGLQTVELASDVSLRLGAQGHEGLRILQ